jgi:hypothetical protein
MRLRTLVFFGLLAAGCRTQPISTNDGGAPFDLAGGVTYVATLVPTSQQRLSIEKVDFTNDRCTTILLVDGGAGMANASITAPAGWVVNRAWQVQSTTCALLTPPNDAALATAVDGTFAFDPTTFATISIHAHATFPAASESLDVDNLAIAH